MNLNEQLIAIYTQWENQVLRHFEEKHVSDIQNFSRPFYTGISSNNPNDQIMMIVGQEANKFCKFTDMWPMNEIQHWSIQYLDRQVNKIDNNLKYNRSAFWSFFREFSSNFNVVWSNLDRLHRYEHEKTVSLKEEDEAFLNQQYGNDMKSLLQREIEIIKPAIIVFTVGPNYWFSMKSSLGLPEKTELQKPCHSSLVIDISDVIKEKNSIVLWTYHPTHLRRQGYFNICINEINKSWKR